MDEEEKTIKGRFGKIFFQWEIVEYLTHQRSNTWYAIMAGLAALLIIYSILAANFLFALIIIIAAFILFLRGYFQPSELIFQITDNGLVVGNEFFDYKKIKSFWFIYDPPAVKKIFFNFKGMHPTISIPLDKMNPLVIRQKLLAYLPEDLEKEHQTFDDQLETIFKL